MAVGTAHAQDRPILDIYRDIHAHPELARHEERTAALGARELKAAGYEVTEHVGRYPDGQQGFGVVGLLRNGKGPTLLIRADMDALPIVEETGAPYASRVVTTGAGGRQVGAMHACGHDIHASVLIGTARRLAAERKAWAGTVMLVAQPAEETAEGAKAMLADRFYERFGRPDMVIGLHDGSNQPAGKAGIAIGPAQAGVTSIDVTVRGLGGHGALPENGRDPVVLAAQFVSELQTVVSREADPLDPVVVTVGTIHGGTRRNIIPDEVKLELTTRAFSDAGRAGVIDGIRRRAAALAVSAGLPPERTPVVTVLDNETTPPLYNDPALATRVQAALVATLGRDNVYESKPVMPSEDVGFYGLPGRQIPVAYFALAPPTPPPSPPASPSAAPTPPASSPPPSRR